MDNNERKQGLSDIGEEVFARRANTSPLKNAMPGSEGTPAQKAVPPRKEIGEKTPLISKIKAFIAKIKEKNKYGGFRLPEIAKKTALIGFSALSLAALLTCTFIGYSYSGDSIRVHSELTESSRSSSRAYRIVYSEADPWGAAAAATLRDLFFEKTGASLKIVTDAEKVGRHEIRIGYTNRAGDNYLTSASALGADGYAILILPGDNVSITAFSEAGANAAVKYFVSSYVGSYRAGNLIFANKMSVSVVSRGGDEPSSILGKTKVPLSFSEEGKFRALVLSDADINTSTIEAIGVISNAEKPDIVIFAGDVSSGISTKAELERYVQTLTAPLESRRIPWTVIFGEQDTDGGLSASAQMEVYTSFAHCVAKSDFSSDGTVSCFLPIYKWGEDGESGDPVFGIWGMGQTPMLSLTGSGASGDALLSSDRESGTDYGYVPSAHIAFFSETQDILDRAAGGSLSSIVVSHTPVPEFKIIAENAEATKMTGSIGEPVSASPLNSGLFTALVDAGNVLGLYSGHDHLNAFSGIYCGIELGYSASIGYDGYGFGGTFELNNRLRGGRLIELTLSQSGEITSASKMVYAADYGIGIN
ncbi:MAG: hypothetical protein E7671_01795 [Ruminococcaceae bacterium]|nr:hypothetical protein [Oscillospiraceae bacterium]